MARYSSHGTFFFLAPLDVIRNLVPCCVLSTSQAYSFTSTTSAFLTMDYDDETAQEWQITGGDYSIENNTTSECNDYWFVRKATRKGAYFSLQKFQVAINTTISFSHLLHRYPSTHKLNI